MDVAAGQEEVFLASAQKSEETLAEHLKAEHVKAIAYPNGKYTHEETLNFIAAKN